MPTSKNKNSYFSNFRFLSIFLGGLLVGTSSIGLAIPTTISTEPLITIDGVSEKPIIKTMIEAIQYAHKVSVNVASLSLIKTPQIPFEVHLTVDENLTVDSKYELMLKHGVLVHTVRLSNAAAQNIEKALPDLALLAEFAGNTRSRADLGKKLSHTNPFAFLELYNNAEQGSKIAQLEIAKLKRVLLSDLKNPALQASADFHKSSLDSLIARLEVEAKQQLRQKETAFKKERQASNTLESYEAMETKLNDLVLANDRKGVRKMLEAYLPWTLMEPQEVSTWKVWLEAIENPRPQDGIVMLRGLDYSTDKLQRDSSGKIGMFSTVLTKNQGSYTRRLRSLVTNRVKNGIEPNIDNILMGDYSKQSDQASKTGEALLLSNQFLKHSLQPDASSFISFTPVLEIADQFAKAPETYMAPDGSLNVRPRGGIIAVKVDPRRIFFNFTSSYQHEVEFLLPLIIFPDEVIAYEEKVDSKLPAETYRNHMAERLSKLATIKLEKTSLGSTELINQRIVSQGNIVKLRTEDLNTKYLEDVFLKRHSLNMCEKIF